MATVYISIGTPKTGTTALQTFLMNNSEALHKQNCHFPILDLGIEKRYVYHNAQWLVYSAPYLVGEEKKAREHEVYEKGLEQIRKEVQGYDKIILSEEMIWYRSPYHPTFFKDVVELFREMGCEVKFILYLRRQDQLVESLWNQAVKGVKQTTKTFEECLNGDFFNYFPLDYAKRIGEILEQIDREQLIIRVFERSRFKNGDLFEDFFDVCGLQLTDEFVRDDVRDNMALDGNFLEMMRIMNHVPGEHDKRAKDARIEHGRKIAAAVRLSNDLQRSRYQYPKTSMFSKEEAAAYLARYEESNAKVAREYLGFEDGVLFREPIKELPKWEYNKESEMEDLLILVAHAIRVEHEEILKLRAETADLRRELRIEREKTRSMYKSPIFRMYRKLRGQKDVEE